MKQSFVTTLFFSFFCSIVSIAQKNSYDYFINEAGVSVNHSVFVSGNYGTKTSFGGGVALYRSFRENTHINPVIGVDYNFTGFTVESIRVDMDYYYKNASFRYHQIRVPYSVRFHVGKQRTFFMEPGLFLNFLAGGTIKGTTHTTELGQVTESPFKTRIDEHFGLGASFGVGTQIPLKTGRLLLKADILKGLSNTSYENQGSVSGPLYYNSYLRFMVIYQFKQSVKE